MTNNKRKGKRVELDIVHWLKDRGYFARRSVQFCGMAGDSDVITADEQGIDKLNKWHIEVKGTKEAILNKSKLREWVTQAERDCPQHKSPVILTQANNKDLVAILIQNGKGYFPLNLTDNFAVIEVGDSLNPTAILEKGKLKSLIAKFFNLNFQFKDVVIYFPIFTNPLKTIVFMDANVWLTHTQCEASNIIPDLVYEI